MNHHLSMWRATQQQQAPPAETTCPPLTGTEGGYPEVRRFVTRDMPRNVAFHGGDALHAPNHTGGRRHATIASESRGNDRKMEPQLGTVSIRLGTALEIASTRTPQSRFDQEYATPQVSGNKIEA